MASSFNTRSEECPSKQDLKAYVQGQLESDAAGMIASHVARCDTCRQLYDNLKERHNAETNLLLPDDSDFEAKSTVTEDLVDEDCLEERFDQGLFAPSLIHGALGKLGKYDVLSVLGSGGMGVVFKGFDEELRRSVALKVLTRVLCTSATARRRFVREARAAAAVNHPNVVTIHGVENHNELPFIVMEYVSGISLRDRLRQQPIEPLEALRISNQIATGLAAAHLQGVIHRDIKPGNILLEEGESRVKITDFGLARVAVDNVELTSRHVAVGTPAYMSPEQVRSDTLDARSDLFSLGCVMYAMFAGHSPFHGRTALESARKVVDETPPPLESVARNVPRFYSEIVARLLEKDPGRRFQSAQEVASTIEGYVRSMNQMRTDELPGVMNESLPPKRRPPLGWLRTAALLVMFGLFLGLSTWWNRPQSVTDPVRTLISETPPPEKDWLRGEITVSKTGPARFKSISDALKLAGPGAKIRVQDAGEYSDPLVLDRPAQWQGVTLESDKGATLIAPDAPSVVRISGVPDFVLRGFKMRASADQFGIEMTGECAGTRVENIQAERVVDSDGRSRGYSLSFLYLHAGAAGTADSPIAIHGLDVRGGGIGIQIGDEEPREGVYVPVKWVRLDECTVIGRARDIGYQLILVNAMEHIVVARSTFARGACGVSFLVKQPQMARNVTITHNTFHELNCWLVFHDTPLEQDSVEFQKNLICRTSQVTLERRNLEAARSWFVGNGWLPLDVSLDPLVLQVAESVPSIKLASEDMGHADYLKLNPESWKSLPPGTELPGRFGISSDRNRQP